MSKKAIPAAVRRAVARAAGCEPGGECIAACVYCSKQGSITWWRTRRGVPGGWVSFTGLELDHVVPESAGGAATSANIVLACRRCNRTKGPRHPSDWKRGAE